MANSVDVSYPINGSRLFTAEVHIVGDGSGEESATVIVDASSLTNAPSSFKVRAIQWSLVGFSAELLWDATTDDHAYSLPEGSDGLRFSDTGQHLVNPASTGYTGDLVVTTTGLGSGDHGTIIIEGQHD